MKREALLARFRSLAQEEVPLPARGKTAERHRRLMEVGREDLSLARLVEAHWDAVAILAEAGRKPADGAFYGVWAAETPGQALKLEERDGNLLISGKKPFCSGARIVNRALVTVTAPDHRLLEIDLVSNEESVCLDASVWKTNAFYETGTATAVFRDARVPIENVIGGIRWYLDRPGFWHGACGPAACWAGGGSALVDYAMSQSRHDPHTLAHLGAMHTSVWGLRAYLESAGNEIDANGTDVVGAKIRGLTLRHLVEQECTEILRRLGRAYGSHPLAMDAEISLKYQELELYLRQCHGERDLEALGREIR